MADKLKVTTIGNSMGVILPRELLARLRVDKGDFLHVGELPDGIKLTPYDEEFARQMDTAETVMRNRRDVLRELANEGWSD